MGIAHELGEYDLGYSTCICLFRGFSTPLMISKVLWTRRSSMSQLTALVVGQQIPST